MWIMLYLDILILKENQLKTCFILVLAIVIGSLFVISFKSNRKRDHLPIPIDAIDTIIVTKEGQESVFHNTSTIKEVVRIFKNSSSYELIEENVSKRNKVKVRLINSNLRRDQAYLIDIENEAIEILSMQKTQKFRIEEMDCLDTILGLRSD